MFRSFLSATTIFVLSAAPAMAHEAHCHVKDADGKLSDATTLTTKADCQKASGQWKHHHAHCHSTGKKHADVHGVSTEADCLAKGGSWEDHGHDALKRTAR